MARRSIIHHSRRFPLVTFLLLSLSLLTLTTCSSDDPTETPPPNNTIGPAGGMVTAPGGASVTVPAGALTQDVTLSVKSFSDPSTGPYPAGPVPVFWGGAQFGPDGTTFLKPVTIALPLRQRLNPGDQYQLFVYDPTNLRWEIMKESATVTAYGTALIGEVSHFSVINGGGNPGGGQARSDLTAQLCSFGSAQAVCEAYVAYFKQYVAKVGDKGVYDDECKEVVGLSMDVTCEINGDNYFLPVRDGEFVGEQVSIYDADDCGEGDGDYGMLDAFATIYYRCGLPRLTAAADPATIELGGSSTLTADLTCGETVFPGQTVYLAREGVGRIQPGSGVTDAAGRIYGTYTNTDREGEATISFACSACPGQPNAGSAVAEVPITTTGGWTGTLTVDFDHPIGGSPLDNFADGVTIDFNFTIDDQGNITGTGTGTHAVNVTPGGECWNSSTDAPGFAAVVYGTATDQMMNFKLAPNPMMQVSFVITCQQGDETVDYPYPMAEGLIEGEILTLDVAISVARTNGATDSGSGSRSDGEDLPMAFSWDVVVNSEGN